MICKKNFCCTCFNNFSFHTPPPRTNRINITRTPQVHIQRNSVPNSVRFANFLSNHLQNQVNHLRASATASTTSTPPQAQQTATQTSTAVSGHVATLNDAQLNTPIPLFGSNDVQLQIRDLVNVSPTPSTFNRIRCELREFVMLKLSLTSNPSEEDVALVIYNLLNILNTFRASKSKSVHSPICLGRQPSDYTIEPFLLNVAGLEHTRL